MKEKPKGGSGTFLETALKPKSILKFCAFLVTPFVVGGAIGAALMIASGYMITSVGQSNNIFGGIFSDRLILAEAVNGGLIATLFVVVYTLIERIFRMPKRKSGLFVCLAGLWVGISLNIDIIGFFAGEGEIQWSLFLFVIGCTVGVLAGLLLVRVGARQDTKIEEAF